MSRQNVEIARRIFEAFNRTFTEGTDDLYALLDPDVEWIPVMAILEGRSYHGHGGVREWIEDMKRDWEAFEPRPEDFRDLGDDRVLVLGSWRARGRGGDVPLDFPRAAWLGQYREGKLVRMQTFTERKDALEAAGLRE
jgi:ketosteroid isomerase-like protein